MQPSEQELVESAFEDFLQEFVAFVTRTSAIAMNEEKLLAFASDDFGFAVQLDAEFVAEIAKRP